MGLAESRSVTLANNPCVMHLGAVSPWEDWSCDLECQNERDRPMQPCLMDPKALAETSGTDSYVEAFGPGDAVLAFSPTRWAVSRGGHHRVRRSRRGEPQPEAAFEQTCPLSNLNRQTGESHER
jgi:hypothetical protein